MRTPMPTWIQPPPLGMQRSLGWDRRVAADPEQRRELLVYVGLQLAASGIWQWPQTDGTDHQMPRYDRTMLASLREKNRLLADHRPPIDQRIAQFLRDYFGAAGVDAREIDAAVKLPSPVLELDRHGMARELSLPENGDYYRGKLVETYRLHNGVLNNPHSDRRTTAGTFHITEGGLPIPWDKRAVPVAVFARLLAAAMRPPDDDLVLPYTADIQPPARCWAGLTLRPLVCPPVPGHCAARSLEVRFFAPGSLVSNLDFVESVFGNAGHPLVPENDAALDIEHWTGHTGCVILAPHLVDLTKRQLGLPHISQATPRQIRDRMCYEHDDERYNDGSAFKICCRDARGVIVTVIADNYFGYCKKEVKTQISYAANLLGGVEEEHAGGALAFASYSLGDEFQVNSRRYNGRTFADVARDYSDFIEVQPEGYGIDRFEPTVLYIPENSLASLRERRIRWQDPSGKESSIPLRPDQVYIAPSGYQIRLEKHPAAPSWRLLGTVGEGLLCHKPCTVSGGGKSEISKSLRDYMLYGPLFVQDREADFQRLREIFERDYADRWRTDATKMPEYLQRDSRQVLDTRRSLGSVIKLLTPSPDYTDSYNAWLASIPDHIYAMALIIKRFYRPEWGDRWWQHFGVDIVNGSPGHELKFGDRKLVGTYLRIGLDRGDWRTFKLRQDFVAAVKVQMEDDITASVVAPAREIGAVGAAVAPAVGYKFVSNCEYRLFQRPDDAVHRGLDKQTERDLAGPGNFLCNFEPLPAKVAGELADDAISFDQFTPPMQELLLNAARDGRGYVVSSAHPRLVDGKPTQNPRYLQDRPDLARARDTYAAERGVRLFRALPADQPVRIPVGAVLSGRRNNPADPATGIHSLAIYGPIHYQEPPELLADYLASLSGKSPSTTGAGSEGALTKGPFNAMPPTLDLNTTLVSLAVTGLGGFSTAAGYIGQRFEVGHDLSLLIPEIWCRMGPEERDPRRLIDEGLLERLEDFSHNGQSIPASRLGFRINERFVNRYFGRVFDNPARVFTPEILRPELQDLDLFAAGVLHLAEQQRRIAAEYLGDGSLSLACPPLQALLICLAHGSWEGHTMASPEFRTQFAPQTILSSEWYRRRLAAQQARDAKLWKRFVESLEEAVERRHHADVVAAMQLEQRLQLARERVRHTTDPAYIDSLHGELGVDPLDLHDPRDAG
jgi:hypothetical protein